MSETTSTGVADVSSATIGDCPAFETRHGQLRLEAVQAAVADFVDDEIKQRNHRKDDQYVALRARDDVMRLARKFHDANNISERSILDFGGKLVGPRADRMPQGLRQHDGA